MALAVCLLFDEQGDRTIRQLWARLESRGVATPLTHTHGRHRPHLSLAVARTWDLPAVQQSLNELPAGEPVNLLFQALLTFARGRSALAAAVSADLVRRQEAVARALLGVGTDLHRYYLPGHWVPHALVGTGGSAQALPVVAVAVNDTLPLAVHVAQAALIDSGTGDLWPLPFLP